MILLCLSSLALDMILVFLICQVLNQKVHRSFKNVRVVSNRMVFDENGHLQSFKGITYHHLEVLFT